MAAGICTSLGYTKELSHLKVKSGAVFDHDEKFKSEHS